MTESWPPEDVVSYRAEFLTQVMPKGGVGAELGVYKGYFAWALLGTVCPEKLHLIDPWYLQGERWSWGGNHSTIEALAGILRVFAPHLASGRVVLHIGDDLEVLPTFPDDYFDWVYVDSVHEYGHASEELARLATRVKAGGIIAGDDWASDPGQPFHGVCRAVHDFIEREPYELIYASDEDKQWAIQRK